MREYPDNHRGLFDRGDDLQVAATLQAVFEVDSESALEQTRPAHPPVFYTLFGASAAISDSNSLVDSSKS